MLEQMPLPEAVVPEEKAAVAVVAEPSDETEAARVDRRALEAQLEALKRKESELRRALAITDHPELAEAIRVIEGRAYAIGRIEAKIAQGLSKSEERKRETLEKKLASLREKRTEIDTQIGDVEAQLAPLGQARVDAFEAERREALQQLIVTMSTHDDALRKAELDVAQLVPDVARLMPEIVSLAEHLAARSIRQGD